MNLKALAKTTGLLVCLMAGLGMASCNTSKGTKKCPTCPEWSSPAKPAH